MEHPNTGMIPSGVPICDGTGIVRRSIIDDDQFPILETLSTNAFNRLRESNLPELNAGIFMIETFTAGPWINRTAWRPR